MSKYTYIQPHDAHLLLIIRRAIDKTGLTNAQVAEKAGLSASTLSRFLNGKMRLGEDKVEALGEVCGQKDWGKRDSNRKAYLRG